MREREGCGVRGVSELWRDREGATHRAFGVAVYQPAGPDVLILVAGEEDQQGIATANEAVRGAGRVDRCSVHYWILCYANIIYTN